MEPDIRRPGTDDEPSLRHIWKTVFASDDEDAFFGFLYDPDMCSTAYHDSTLAAAGYLLPAGNIVCGESAVPATMIYAVATLPDFRGLGYGTAIVHDLISKSRAAGYPAIVLCPADDGLFRYYADHTEFHDWFYVSERRIKKPANITGRLTLTSGTSTLTSSTSTLTESKSTLTSGRSKLIEIQADEYAQLREELLKGTPHINIDLNLLAYQSLLCREFGGGLFRIDTGGRISCAAIETDSDNTVRVIELLGDKKNISDVFSAISEEFPAGEYVVRTPVMSAGGICGISSHRFGMLAAPPGVLDAVSGKKPLPWYGLAFE